MVIALSWDGMVTETPCTLADMPYSIIRVSLKTSTQRAPAVRELLENAIDEAAIRNFPVSEISVEDECTDPPTDSEDDL